MRNWAPCSIGVRVYRLHESPLEKRSHFYEGLPRGLQNLLDPVPIAQTRLRPHTEWIFRPTLDESVVARSENRLNRKKGEACPESGGEQQAGDEDSVSSFGKKAWDPVRICDSHTEYELIVYSMDGVVLDEDLISRGEVGVYSMDGVVLDEDLISRGEVWTALCWTRTSFRGGR